MNYENQRFMDLVLLRTPSLAKHFQFTAPGSTGKLHDGLFYHGSKEIILVDDASFNVDDCISNWEEVEAIQVLEHPISDLGFLLPTGKRNTTETGLAVVKIHIGKLLAQYRGWLLKQSSKVFNIDTHHETEAQFVYAYVLPKMMKTHLDLVVFNRLVNLHTGAPMGEALLKHPFQVIDYSDKLDRVLEKVLERLKTINVTFPTLLENIPAVHQTDMLKALKMPHMSPTRQVWWALLVTRLKAISFILSVIDQRTFSQNRVYLNDLRIDCRELLRENMLKSVLPQDMYYDINKLIKRLAEI